LSVRTVASAAVRLGIIGGYDAQHLQSSLGPAIDEAAAECGALDPLEIAQPSPIVDLCQSTHDRLYSRLFQS
jgi:urease accessory protein